MADDLSGISPDADTLIISEEVGSQAYYEQHYQHPEWPGGQSGVTIGVGFDCGYSTPAEIDADWGPLLSPTTVQALKAVSGVKGSPAHSHAQELHWVTVPWAAAITVFHNRDLPKWTAIVRGALPNCDLLNGDCFGALTSLTFNRGASYNSVGDRYTEMRNIKAHMAEKAFDLIPAEFLSMRRLWPTGGDLWRRREHEAALFTKGLNAMHASSTGASTS